MQPETIDAAPEDVTEETDNLPAVQRHEAVVARSEITVDELLDQRTKITDVMQRAMERDTHYGVISGTTKPALLKPGAELLNVLLRLAPSYKSERTFHDDGHLTVVSYCTLTHIPTGLVISGGEGLCSTRESKYAYRQGGRSCPVCGQEAIIKGKAEYGGGWVCFKKKGGCGEKFADGTPEAAAFESAEVGKVANPDLADSYNTVLKMADKRALIAAVLNGTAASDVFTQDVDDNAPAQDSAPPATNPRGGAEKTPAAGDDPRKMPAAFADAKPAELVQRLTEALEHVDRTVLWFEVWEAAIVLLYGKPGKDLSQAQTKEAWTRLANVADRLSGGGDFPPRTEVEVQEAFAWAFGGHVVEVLRAEPEAAA